MSISQSLQNALSGLTASSRAAEIVSSNLANVGTEGYGVRRVNLSAADRGGDGAGVQIDGISRMVDLGLLEDRRFADADVAAHSFKSSSFSRLETVIGGIGDDHEITDKLVALEDALTLASSDPSSPTRLTQVSTRLDEVAQALNTASDQVQVLRQEADSSIAHQVDQLNTALKSVEQLNFDIRSAVTSGYDATALMDQRQVIVDQISEIVPVRQIEKSTGMVSLITTGGLQLVDGPARQFEFHPTNTIVADMTFAAGSLSGITIDGNPIVGGNGYGPLSGGKLGAAFELRDQDLVDIQAGLDATARDLVERFQSTTTDPTIGATDPGLLTDSGARFDPLDEIGLASRISINAAIDGRTGGNPALIRDGLGSVGAGPVGNSAQIDAWSNALTEKRVFALTGATGSAAEITAFLSNSVSQYRVRAEDQLTVSNARWESLKNAELAKGVDSDHELQQLMLIEEAYAANARVIQTVNSMMQTLMEI